MQVPNKLHILKIIILYSWTHVEHYELDVQSVGREKKKRNFAHLERSQYEISHFRVFQLTLKNV